MARLTQRTISPPRTLANGAYRPKLRYLKSDASGTTNNKTIIFGGVNGNRLAGFSIVFFGLKSLTAGDFAL